MYTVFIHIPHIVCVFQERRKSRNPVAFFCACEPSAAVLIVLFHVSQDLTLKAEEKIE